MAVDVERAGVFGSCLEPLTRKQARPFFGSLALAELSQLPSQAADFGNAIQPHQFSQFARCFVLQLLDRLDAAERHVPQQRHHLECRVIAAQRRQRLLQMLEQPVGRQGRQGAEHAAERNISGIFKPSRGALQDAHRSQDTLFGTCASDTHFRRGIGQAPLGFVGGLPRRVGSCGPRRLLEPSLVDRFAERVVADAQFGSYLGARTTATQEPLSLRQDLVCKHGRAASLTRLKEASDPFFPIFLDATFDAVDGNSKPTHDL